MNEEAPVPPDVVPPDVVSTNVARCPNCDTEITGPYCAACGQQQKNLNRYIWTLAGELFEEVFRPDSRALRTLFALLFKPGYLTTEYFAGRRMRYVPPVRLYLIISFLFFVILPLLGNVSDDNSTKIDIKGDAETSSDWKEDIKDSTSEISLPWFTDEENAKLSERFDEQIQKTVERAEENPTELIGNFMDVMSAIMFFLLPIFAIFLKFFYLGSGFYYAEHLLLAVHNHCFLFLALLTSSLLELAENTIVGPVTSAVDTALILWIPAYMFISMKHAYNNGYFVTTLKFMVLSTSYLFLALIGVIATAILGIFMV